jgi:hypothetical protein
MNGYNSKSQKYKILYLSPTKKSLLIMKFNNEPTKNLCLIAGVVLMSFLVSCGSSNQLASSFGKRKYMKGHFSDQIASIKTKYKASNIIAEPAPVRYANKIELPKVSGGLLSVANAKVLCTTVTRPLAVMCKKHTAAKSKAVILPLVSPKSNATIAVANSDESITTYHHGGGGDGGTGVHTLYGKLALYCLLLALLWFIVAFSGIATPAVVPIMIVFGVVFLVVAVIYLALWLATAGG